jgi:O-antigen ligase
MIRSQNRFAAARNMAGRAWWIAPTRTASMIGSPVRIVPEKAIPASVRWLLLLFVFSMPFEMYPSSFTSGSLSLAKIAGALFIAVYLTHYNPFSRTRSLPRFSRAMWGFAGYLAVFALNGFFSAPGFFDSLFSRFLTMTQLVVFFWIASDLLRDEGLARKALHTYALAASAVALAMLVGVSGLSVTYKTSVGARMSSMGFNPNTLSVLLVLAALILMGLYLILPPLRFTRKVWLVALALPLVPAVVSTGSRNGIVIFVLGFLVYLLPSRRYRGKPTVPILAMLAIAAVVYFISQNSAILTRFQQTYERGDLSGRLGIYTEAIEMISEQPLFGWRPVEFWYELGRRVQGFWRIRDAHNTYLHLLLEVGFAGAIPFAIGLWFCARAAWRGRNGTLGLLPLALVMAVLAGGMSGTDIARKHLWFVLAIAVATEPVVARRRAAEWSPGRAPALPTYPAGTLPQHPPYVRDRGEATF